MQIIKSFNPVIAELSDADITLIHLALYEYKDFLKKDKKLRKDKKRSRLKALSRMITLVDLLM